ncbi:Histone deacetylase 8 [Lobosporangium transversale]|uniref:Histone deacetylase n=1 Tax=Lobosporangium transversale TaxID=64571 RepID=A0A1Y2H1M9_9FUNG|nr:histone deacetylase 8 [Lobosporangium transversale]KAF9917604.1 Histone deacetylase 8 [Lobosporangium transversale]ORZ27901.1 histone deacetylase 8 [Lobosporangium transversale]|eukprot:XP_021885604.1 histone deacetylase 8 [Lobosporangium transversale]
MSSSHAKRIAYIYSKEYAGLASLLPSNIDRSITVHALIDAYGLLNHPDITIVSPQKATLKELCRYHSRDYIEFLQKVEENNASDENEDCITEDSRMDQLEEYGLRYDCSVFEGIAQYAELVAGSTIKAARLINDDAFDIVVHWDGGRHHAKKDMAAGFCIVNDIVLGIMELQKVYDRVMYIDLDVHHGDGVENAFQFTDKVLTVSLHHYAEGFYPGTGSGISSNKTKAVVNVPLKSGLSQKTLSKIFDQVVEPLSMRYNPGAIVLQCGVDGMAGDPLGKWNLNIQSYGDCLKKIMTWKRPLIILGGGGYKTTSTAKCYAYLTSIVIGKQDISEEIPEHEYFEDYAPDFQLAIDPSRQVDENTDSNLEGVYRLVETQTETLLRTEMP